MANTTLNELLKLGLHPELAVAELNNPELSAMREALKIHAVATFTNFEDGMAAVITEGQTGYHVTLRDTDADQTVDTTIYPYTLADAKAKAYAKAKEVLLANAPTAQQKKDAVTILVAAAEAVRKAGRVPSGTLYAILMGRVDFEGYTKMINILKGAGLIEERSHELIWTGPALAAAEPQEVRA